MSGDYYDDLKGIQDSVDYMGIADRLILEELKKLNEKSGPQEYSSSMTGKELLGNRALFSSEDLVNELVRREDEDDALSENSEGPVSKRTD